MKKLFILLTIVGIFAFGGLTGCRRSTPLPQNDGWAVAPSEKDLLREINQYRTDNGKSPFEISSELSDAAQGHADYMAETGNFSHRGKSWSTPASRATKSGYSWRSIAENIAYGQRTVSEAVNSWHRSSGHRRNMLGDFADIGIGITVDENGRIYWVTMFGNQSHT